MTRSRRHRELEEAAQAEKEKAELPRNRTALVPLCEDRRRLSKSNVDLRKKRDFTEAPLRAGWPALTPLPIRTYDAFPVGEPPLLSDRRFHIQRIRSLCGMLGIQTGGIEVVLRVPENDLTKYHSCRVTQLEPQHTMLPLKEYLTLLVKLDLEKHGRQVPSVPLAIRRLFMECDATRGLMIEFLDYNCGWGGYKWRTYIHGHRNELALKAWEDNAFQSKLSSLLKVYDTRPLRSWYIGVRRRHLRKE